MAGCRGDRRLAATINYLAQDHPGLQLAARILSRSVAKPMERAWAGLQKVGRYCVRDTRKPLSPSMMRSTTSSTRCLLGQTAIGPAAG